MEKKKPVSIGGEKFEPVQNVETDAICSCCEFLHYCTKHNPADETVNYKILRADGKKGECLFTLKPSKEQKVAIPKELYDRLNYIGIIPNETRSHNVGASDYSKHVIQPWSIWRDYDLNPWDADIVKRILRTKETDTRKMDYEKIIHICQERIRQINIKEEQQ